MENEKRPQFKNNGVKSAIILTLVENTAPFLFGPELKTEASTRYAEILRAAKGASVNGASAKGAPVKGASVKGASVKGASVKDTAVKDIASRDTDLWSYFELCIASHFATVGTYVPTDLDLAIRSKLWHPVHNQKHIEPMLALVQEFKTWDESLVSKRFIKTKTGRKLSGHQGEWFTIAMGLYGSSLRVAKDLIPETREMIEAEMKNQEAAITELKEAFLESSNVETAKNYFSGIAAVAHNLGDLDRMFELWALDDIDVLKRRVFRSGHEDAKNPKPVFIQAGRIYQSMLANENHRHFALREPKPLRKYSKFLLPFGPFMDDWGKSLVKDGLEAGLFNEGELREIAEALISGWKKLNAHSIYHSQGYARALFGIAEGLGKRADLENLLPPVLKKELNEGGLRTLMGVSKNDFEKKWMVKLRTELTAP